MASGKIDFSRGPVWRCILAQALPLTVAQLVQLLYNVVDRIYLGHMGDGNSLALTGVGLTFPVITLIMAFTALFGNGGVPLFAMARGAGDEEKALDDLEIKWGEDYPIVIKSWCDNWGRLTTYFQYSQHIRRIIYTTNTVEGYQSQLRKVPGTRTCLHLKPPLKNLSILHLREYERSGRNRCRTGDRRPSNWPSCSRTGSGYWPDNIFCLESFDDIDNFAVPFWDIDGPKTAPKYNLTQFSLPY